LGLAESQVPLGIRVGVNLQHTSHRGEHRRTERTDGVGAGRHGRGTTLTEPLPLLGNRVRHRHLVLSRDAPLTTLRLVHCHAGRVRRGRAGGAVGISALVAGVRICRMVHMDVSHSRASNPDGSRASRGRADATVGRTAGATLGGMAGLVATFDHGRRGSTTSLTVAGATSASNALLDGNHPAAVDLTGIVTSVVHVMVRALHLGALRVIDGAGADQTNRNSCVALLGHWFQLAIATGHRSGTRVGDALIQAIAGPLATVAAGTRRSLEVSTHLLTTSTIQVRDIAVLYSTASSRGANPSLIGRDSGVAFLSAFQIAVTTQRCGTGPILAGTTRAGSAISLVSKLASGLTNNSHPFQNIVGTLILVVARSGAGAELAGLDAGIAVLAFVNVQGTIATGRSGGRRLTQPTARANEPGATGSAQLVVHRGAFGIAQFAGKDVMCARGVLLATAHSRVAGTDGSGRHGDVALLAEVQGTVTTRIDGGSQHATTVAVADHARGANSVLRVIVAQALCLAQLSRNLVLSALGGLLGAGSGGMAGTDGSGRDGDVALLAEIQGTIATRIDGGGEHTLALAIALHARGADKTLDAVELHALGITLSSGTTQLVGPTDAALLATGYGSFADASAGFDVRVTLLAIFERTVATGLLLSDVLATTVTITLHVRPAGNPHGLGKEYARRRATAAAQLVAGADSVLGLGVAGGSSVADPGANGDTCVTGLTLVHAAITTLGRLRFGVGIQNAGTLAIAHHAQRAGGVQRQIVLNALCGTSSTSKLVLSAQSVLAEAGGLSRTHAATTGNGSVTHFLAVDGAIATLVDLDGRGNARVGLGSRGTRVGLDRGAGSRDQLAGIVLAIGQAVAIVVNSVHTGGRGGLCGLRVPLVGVSSIVATTDDKQGDSATKRQQHTVSLVHNFLRTG